MYRPQEQTKVEPIDFGNRKRELEFRRNWFHQFRSTDSKSLSRLWVQGLREKRRLIRRGEMKFPHLAAYSEGPAAAGTPWFTIGPRNINGRVKCLAVHPTNPNIVYAGAASGGVWKSIDGCESWRPLWDTTDTMAAVAIAIVPNGADDVLFVGTGEWTPGWGPGYPGAGLYVSTDSGTTWTLHSGVTARRVAQVLATSTSTVYVAGDSGFERSTDGGVTWTILHTGEISDAVVDPNNPLVLYIAVRSDRIYKTTDGGTNWTGLSTGPTGVNADWLRLAIGKSGGAGSSHICAKRAGTIFRSTNGGATWATLAGAHGDASYDEWCNLLAVAPDDDNIILVGGVGGERTGNTGGSWAGFSGPELHADYHRAIFAPSNTNTVYHCSDGGVFRSKDKGITWEKASDGLTVTQFYDVNAWSKYSNVIGGGTQDNGTNVRTGGLTWKRVFGADGGYLVVHPTNPRIMYAETQNTGLVKTTNGAASWTGVTAGLTGSTSWVGVLTMDPNHPDTLYVGTNAVHKTTNGCLTPWTAVSQTLPGQVSSIAVAPSDSNRVYVTAGSQAFRSDDAGATSPWPNKTAAPLPARLITDVVVDIANRDRVALAFGGPSGVAGAQAVFMSTNGGNSWTDISGDLPAVGVNAIELDPANSSIVYVGTDVGAFRTTDGGTSWHAFDNGLPNVPISDLYLDPEDQALFAATMGRGMYKVSIATTPAPNVDLYLRDDDLDTGERFPTPSNEPNPLDATDQEFWWESPDIKVQSTPFYVPDAVFDGVEFDQEVVHEDPIRGVTNRFYLQMHNRGWQNATNVKVRAFFANASAGLPALPVDFWTAFPNSNPSGTDWTPVGAAKTIPVLEPNRPVIVSWDWVVPLGSATHSCLMAVSTCNEDPITTTQLNPGLLIPFEKRVCLKNLHVVDMGPSPGQSLMTIDFHNAFEHEMAIDIVIDATRFKGGNLGLLLEPHKLQNVDEALRNARIYPLRKGEFIGDWAVRGAKGKDEGLTARLAALDVTNLYEIEPERVAEVRGIPVAAGGVLRGALTALPSRKVDYGELNRVSVMQRTGGNLVGGSTFEFRLKRARGLHPVSKIRITLEKVRIPAKHPLLLIDGDYRLKVSVGFNANPCRRHEVILPREGAYTRGEREPVVNACVFEGYAAEQDRLSLSIAPEEHSLFQSEKLTVYHRDFNGPPEMWVGHYVPGDEPHDPEELRDWMVWYRIESLALA